MTLPEKILNTIGLALGIIGGLLWFFSPQAAPMIISEGVGLGVSDGTRLPEGMGYLGKTVGEHNAAIRQQNAEIERLNKKIAYRLKWALALIVLGFFVQVLAVWE